MFDEKDHSNDKGLTFAGKVAWFMVGFMIVFVILPAVFFRPVPADETPSKMFFSQGLWCIDNGDKLLCDRPALTNPPPTTKAFKP